MTERVLPKGNKITDFRDAGRFFSLFMQYDEVQQRDTAVGAFFRSASEGNAAVICYGEKEQQSGLRAALSRQGLLAREEDARRLTISRIDRLIAQDSEPSIRSAVERIRTARREAIAQGYAGLWVYLEMGATPFRNRADRFGEWVAGLDLLTGRGDLVLLSAFDDRVPPKVLVKVFPLYPAIVEDGRIIRNDYHRITSVPRLKRPRAGFFRGVFRRLQGLAAGRNRTKPPPRNYRRGQVFDAMLKVAPIGLWLLDREHRMVFMNRNFSEETGIPSERYLEARHYSEVMKPEESVKCMLSDALAYDADGPIQCEEELSNVDGTRHTYQIVKSKIMDEKEEVTGLLGMAIDISDRKKAETDLKEALALAEDSRDKIDNIVASIADGLIVTDARNRVVLINGKARELLNLGSLELIGHSIGQVIRDLSLLNQINAAYGHAGNQALQTTFHPEPSENRTGRLLQARTSGMRNKQNEVTGAITILRDVTRERELDRIKAEFLSVAAHELRTPLTSIIGYLEFCMYPEEFGGFSDEQQREFLEEINNKAELLAKLVSDLLDIGRLEAGKPLPLDIRPVDLNRLIGKVVEPYRLHAPHHRFEIDLEENPEGFVRADENKLEQVLENLLSNAVKYSPKDSLVRIIGSTGENVYRVCVEDHGIGMTAEQKARVFDKFYRADFSDTAARGLGLGMSIVRQIIESLGGSIWVESEKQVGTRVYFTVPTMVAEGEGPERT